MLTAFHVLAVLFAGVVVFYSDEQGFMYMRGKRSILSAKKLEWLHALVGVALALLILTGGLLFMRAPSYYLANTTFLIKMGFVGALLVNGFFIDRLSKIASQKPWAELSKRERLPLLISGAISGLCWLGALSCGLLLG